MQNEILISSNYLQDFFCFISRLTINSPFLYQDNTSVISLVMKGSGVMTFHQERICARMLWKKNVFASDTSLCQKGCLTD